MAGLYTLEMLNAIRDAASTNYQDRIPLATRNNITAIGNALLAYAPAFNEFTGLLGKIAMTIVSSKMAQNKLSKFKRGMIPAGLDIEDIWVEMASSEGIYDPTGPNPLGRRLPSILAMYHRENRKDYYAVSISQAQIKSAFTSLEGVNNLITQIVNSLYSGDQHDEYVLMKELLAQYQAKYFNYEVPVINDEERAKRFVKTVRKAVMDLSFMNDSYNNSGVMTYTPVEDQVLIINKDVIAEIDVDVLAKAFNLGKTDFETEVVVVDDFGVMEDTYAILVDKSFFAVWDTLVESAEQFNAQGLFTNVFVHHHQILSLCEFKNAVRFASTLSPDNDILTFVLAAQTGPAVISSVAHTVDIEVANGTDVTQLAPVVTISPWATVSPESGVPTDFTAPVNYTVTSEDGTDQIWVVTVTEALP